jgi:hypothetical protein
MLKIIEWGFTYLIDMLHKPWIIFRACLLYQRSSSVFNLLWGIITISKYFNRPQPPLPNGKDNRGHQRNSSTDNILSLTNETKSSNRDSTGSSDTNGKVHQWHIASAKAIIVDSGFSEDVSLNLFHSIEHSSVIGPYSSLCNLLSTLSGFGSSYLELILTSRGRYCQIFIKLNYWVRTQFMSVCLQLLVQSISIRNPHLTMDGVCIGSCWNFF